MAARKNTKTKKSVKKVVYKKAVRQPKKNKLISFLVGVFTVLAIGFMVFQYAQSNNYKEVLGEKTTIEKQAPK